MSTKRGFEMTIRLDAPRPSDSAALFEWINNAETVRFNAPYRPVALGSHEAWFAGLNCDNFRAFFAIRNGQDLIGSLQLVDIHPVHQTAELIVRIGSHEQRGKGFGTEALKLAVAFAFADLNLQRVWLRVFANNARAIAAYRKAGFTEEGIMRRAAWINGAWVDEVVMAVLR